MKLGQEENRRNLICWARDVQAQSLRIEMANGSFYVFPYNHLTFVRFERENERDTIRITFESHEVQIVGRHLRELGLAFQKCVVDWVKESPARHGPVAEEDHPWVEGITVNEAHD